jgi:hypothetical protein
MKTIESAALGFKFWHGDDHIRTEEENNYKFQGLIKISDILKSENIEMFLSAGTMLGSVRDKDFIPWDWNVSTGVLYDLNNKEKNISEKIIDSGFILTCTIGGKCLKFDNPEFFNFIKIYKHIRFNLYLGGQYFQIENNPLENGFWTRPRHKSPFWILGNGFEKSEIRGYKFNVPSNPEKVAEWMYGKDWKIPVLKTRQQCVNRETFK